MNLVDFVNSIESVDEDSIIFQEDREIFESNTILGLAEEGDGGVKEEGGKKFYYLIEVYLAKEFINDWIESINYKATPEDIAKRLYDYAINDA